MDQRATEFAEAVEAAWVQLEDLQPEQQGAALVVLFRRILSVMLERPVALDDEKIGQVADLVVPGRPRIVYRAIVDDVDVTEDMGAMLRALGRLIGEARDIRIIVEPDAPPGKPLPSQSLLG
jgi:hypothetical protein